MQHNKTRNVNIFVISNMQSFTSQMFGVVDFFVTWDFDIQRHSDHEISKIMVYSGPVHMIPGQLIAPGQLTDPGVNFASVHGLTPVTVHMSFSLPWGNFERRVTRCRIPGNPPCRGNFSPCEQNAKVAPGQEQSCACSFLMFGINFAIKSSRKHQK